MKKFSIFILSLLTLLLASCSISFSDQPHEKGSEINSNPPTEVE